AHHEAFKAILRLGPAHTRLTLKKDIKTVRRDLGFPFRNSPIHPEFLDAAAFSLFLAERWRSRRITPLTTSPTRLTGMASRSLRGIATLQPRGWTRSF
ncbi:unnamed protein product, partial [Linum tenue]